jgi:hypothetical protein
MNQGNPEWTLVKKGNRRAFSVRNRNRNPVPNNSNERRVTRRKILERFFEEDDTPDELFQMGLTPVTKGTRKAAPEPQLLGEKETKKVQAALVEFFREGYEQNVSHGEPASDERILAYINAILVQYKIKISGGFILKNMGMFEGNTGASSIDIDIYLPYLHKGNPYQKRAHTQAIHKALQDLFNVDKVNGKPKHKYFRVTRFASKKQAFFQKNGIYSVTKYSKGETAEMDLVQADTTTTPIRIIQRFDLTFCQNWYDGEHLWSMDKEAVYKRAPGRLEDSYVPLYLDGNPVTRKRIAKYMKRGFSVQYKDPESEEMVLITEENVRNRNS